MPRVSQPALQLASRLRFAAQLALIACLLGAEASSNFVTSWPGLVWWLMTFFGFLFAPLFLGAEGARRHSETRTEHGTGLVPDPANTTSVQTVDVETLKIGKLPELSMSLMATEENDLRKPLSANVITEGHASSLVGRSEQSDGWKGYHKTEVAITMPGARWGISKDIFQDSVQIEAVSAGALFDTCMNIMKIGRVPEDLKCDFEIATHEIFICKVVCDGEVATDGPAMNSLLDRRAGTFHLTLASKRKIEFKQCCTML